MANVAIVTDSTAYIPENEVNESGLTVVPLTINLENGFVVDGIQDNEAFFARVAQSSKIPFTSQPPAGQFQEVYQKLLADGLEIISIHISSKLSGTVESAALATKALAAADRISVVDSLTTTGGLAFLVRAANTWAKQGLPRKEIVSRLEAAKEKIMLMFVPDTLEYLQKGGRIGRAQALLGTLLQLKPILYVDQGEIAVLDKVRTKKKAMQRMLEEIPKNSRLKLAVLHAVAPREANEMFQMAQEAAPEAEVTIDELGPVLCVHTGPKVIGLTVWPLD